MKSNNSNIMAAKLAISESSEMANINEISGSCGEMAA
jgi:hypothetical protein